MDHQAYIDGLQRIAEKAMSEWTEEGIKDTHNDVPDRLVVAQAARVMARRAASQPSPARKAASRANGAKGGRPPRRPPTPGACSSTTTTPTATTTRWPR